MNVKTRKEKQFIQRIQASGLSIYDPIRPKFPKLWIPSDSLEEILKIELRGLSLRGLPLRTRSKVLKEKVCLALGYPIPASFKKTQPRFLGQNFDTYVQKSNNLQIWNEEISADRRYAVIRLSDSDLVESVRVISGIDLARFDKTGKLTQKFQAQFVQPAKSIEIIGQDTKILASIVTENNVRLGRWAPTSAPNPKAIYSLQALGKMLRPLIGFEFSYVGADQERNRGGILHEKISKILGYEKFRDSGDFPDIRHQLLEIKLQTSPTIDLGLVLPSSVSEMDLEPIGGVQVRHCDIRYAVLGAKKIENKVRIENITLVTGQEFFVRFRQFQGKKVNSKLQLPLPPDFFRE